MSIFAETYKKMNENKQYSVLKHVVNLIKNAIGDSKVEEKSTNISIVKDGNDSIHIEQLFDSTGNIATIVITDKKEILYSEDLLEPLQDIHETAGSDAKLKEALQAATIIVNDLSIETEFVLQAVKDSFNELNDSYEFVKTTGKKTREFSSLFKFGDNKFGLRVINEPAKVVIEKEYDKAVTAAVQKIIEADIIKIEQTLNKIFK